MSTPPFTDLDSLLTWLGALPPPDRVQFARLIGDRATGRAVAELADATCYELTRDATQRDVAGQLGVSQRSVRRAVETHLRRHPEGGPA